MYQSNIGKIIFERWQVRENRPEATVKDYFDEVFFKLFFDDERFLMNANNSKFFAAYKRKKKEPLTDPTNRYAALQEFHVQAQTEKSRAGHYLMGGHANKTTDTTSGQVSQIDAPVTPEEVYLSWLGMAAGIGIQGGVSILVSSSTILDQITDGWAFYRRFMNERPALKPHQVETWNGWWLHHVHRNPDYKPHNPLANFVTDGALSMKNDIASLETIPWVKVIFILSGASSSTAVDLPAYWYTLGNTNKTLGFIPIHLQEISRLSDLYNQLFGSKNFIRDRTSLETLYQTQLGIFQACRMGAIGLRALEPKDLRKYMTGADGKKPKTIKAGDHNNNIYFHFYQTWIIAMIDNDQIFQLTQELADLLHGLSGTRGKKEVTNLRNDLLSAHSAVHFIDALTTLMQHKDVRQDFSDETKSQMERLVYQVVNMPRANMPLFQALLRFKFYLND